MTKKVIVATCVVLALAILAFVIALRGFSDDSVYIFADLSECEKLAADEGEFAPYSDPSSDKNLRNLSYLDSFSGEYSCDSFTFEIFAYEFDTAATAKAYFSQATGKNTADLDTNFSLSAGTFSCKLVVLKDNRAYLVTAPTDAKEDILQLLASAFSVKIK